MVHIKEEKKKYIIKIDNKRRNKSSTQYSLENSIAKQKCMRTYTSEKLKKLLVYRKSEKAHRNYYIIKKH